MPRTHNYNEDARRRRLLCKINFGFVLRVRGGVLEKCIRYFSGISPRHIPDSTQHSTPKAGQNNTLKMVETQKTRRRVRRLPANEQKHLYAPLLMMRHGDGGDGDGGGAPLHLLLVPPPSSHRTHGALCVPNRSHAFLANLAFITAAGETWRAAQRLRQCLHSAYRASTAIYVD